MNMPLAIIGAGSFIAVLLAEEFAYRFTDEHLDEVERISYVRAQLAGLQENEPCRLRPNLQ
ncbi:hypothetical protein [Pseudomonas sp. NA-150]|uniref:hypothetical protein n=1 Tax=Pseudomonas sp. NA-150 TaxID=3367525 RepID=UPI0037C73529